MERVRNIHVKHKARISLIASPTTLCSVHENGGLRCIINQIPVKIQNLTKAVIVLIKKNTWSSETKSRNLSQRLRKRSLRHAEKQQIVHTW